MTGTQYPNFIDSFAQLPLLVDGVSQVKADDVNRIRNAIVAVETELGINPSGIHGTVADRLDVLEAGAGGGGSGTVDGSGVADRLAFWSDTETLTSSAALTFGSSIFKVDAATVFNESGANADFRIEGDTDVNLFFADASTDRVGVGTATPSVLLHLKKDQNSPTEIYVENATAGTTAFSNIGLVHNAGAGKFSQYLYNNTSFTTSGLIKADQAGFLTGIGAVGGILLSSNATTGDGLVVSTGGAAAANERVRFYPSQALGGAVFNDSGADYDFRIEGDTDANLFFVDASADRIGFGTSSPSHKIHAVSAADTSITSETTATGSFGQVAASSSSSSALLRANGSTVASTFLGTADASWSTFQSIGGSGFKIGVPGTGQILQLGSFEPAVSTSAVRISLTNDEIIVNDPGHDVDFRIEGDTDTNLFFVDASTDFIGIGNNAPGHKLQVSGNVIGAVTANNTIIVGSAQGSNGGAAIAQTAAIADGSNVYLAAFSTGYSPGGTIATAAGTGLYFDTASTSEAAIASFRNAAAGAPIAMYIGSAGNNKSGTEVLRLTATELIVNDQGRADLDFRVEGDTNTSLLFVDASADRIGVGTTSPSTVFHIDSNAANTAAILTLENTSGNVQVFRTDATPQSSVTGSIGDIAIDSTNGAFYLKTSGTATNTGWTDVLAGSGGANVTLSNLGTTEINTDLLPDTDNTWNIGSPDLRWKDGYFGPDSIHISSTVAERGSAGHWQIKLGNADIDEEVDNTLVFQALETDGYAGKISFSEDGSLRTFVTDDQFAYFGGTSNEPIDFTLRNEGVGEFSGVRFALFNDDEGALINFLTATTWTPEEPGGIDYPDTAIIGATTSNGLSLFGTPVRIGTSFSEEDLVARFDGYTTLHGTDGYAAPVLRLQNVDGYSMAFYVLDNDPEGLVPAGVGSLAIDSVNGSLYIKETGSSITGWSAVGSGVGGGRNVQTITGTDTLVTTDDIVLADATSAAFSINLPAAASSANAVFSIKKIDATANAVTIDASGGELIDGITTYVLDIQYEAVTIACNGSAWFILG